MKPANILVTEETGREHCYLSDFGLTRGPDPAGSQSEPAHLSGTVAYTSPEQITGDSVTGRADVYSLACVLYECLSGAPPFAGRRSMAVLVAHVQDAPPPTLPIQSSGRHSPELSRRTRPIATRPAESSSRTRWKHSGRKTCLRSSSPERRWSGERTTSSGCASVARGRTAEGSRCSHLRPPRHREDPTRRRAGQGGSWGGRRGALRELRRRRGRSSCCAGRGGHGDDALFCSSSTTSMPAASSCSRRCVTRATPWPAPRARARHLAHGVPRRATQGAPAARHRSRCRAGRVDCGRCGDRPAARRRSRGDRGRSPTRPRDRCRVATGGREPPSRRSRAPGRGRPSGVAGGPGGPDQQRRRSPACARTRQADAEVVERACPFKGPRELRRRRRRRVLRA